MSVSPNLSQTAAMAEVVRQFMLLAPRLKSEALSDQELLKARDHIRAMHAGAHHEFGDMGLILSLGQALNQSGEPMTMGDLGRALNVPLSTATRIVDLLVKNGSVQRLPDPDDRRVVRVGLTENGTALYGVIDRVIYHRVERMLRPFSPDERETLIALLRKLVTGLEESL
jgi:DNA-binding MarR family transcriptional regulator